MPSQQYQRAERRKADRKADHERRSVASVASVRFCGTSARKARLVADLIRGLPAKDALRAVRFGHMPSAMPIVERLLKSAVANSPEGEAEGLIVGTVKVSDGPILKRLRPRPYGRGARVRKRMCHISVELMSKKQ